MPRAGRRRGRRAAGLRHRRCGTGAHRRFADIARVNGGSRAAGTAGYDVTASYVEGLLRNAGYTVTVQRFSFQTYVLEASTLEQRTPSAAALPHEVLEYSGSGEATAAVAAPAGALGCAAADFAGFPRGTIALVRRGDCPFQQKAAHAARAGALAVVVQNVDDAPIDGVLGADFVLPMPVVGVSRTAGEQLRARLGEGLTLHLAVRGARPVIQTSSVLAETPGGDPAQVVMAGAHLDSVRGTIGGNDNASGAASLLETALQMARFQPRNKVRFAFWGGEEEDLNGSRTYVAGLGASERARVAVYLNFDMIASPNYVFGVFSGNGRAADGSPLPGNAGAAVPEVFTGYYERLGLPWRIDADDARSDHTSFAEAGIPYGGLFTGDEAVKTPEQAALWGGTAGLALDACYHRPCDDGSNVSAAALEVNAGLVAASVLHFATHGLAR
ncbi:M28 family peptidase [Ramlibacter terrae]|uniref:M28 family peptidase n=1 Tax=Ramlibacter terrae TaxID=2732511 RepID=A0ABX6P1H5_9BURK|nr:M28 family peptidase [Ramlibacter terrae]